MAAVAEYPLSGEQIAFYQEQGYVQLPNVLTPDELEDIRSALDALLARKEDQDIQFSRDENYQRVFVQMVNLWRVDEGFRRLVCNPKLAQIARKLTGSRSIRLWHDHALVKMPGDSRETPWHQDLVYWPMNEAGALSCWLALDDVSKDNGCLQFIPGSFRLGRLEPINLVTPQDIFSMAEGVRMSEAVTMAMSAGGCTFHDGRTFHYATANRTDQPRRAIAIIYMPDGTTYNGNRHIVTDPLGMTPGERFDGELFPVLAAEG